MFFCQAMCRPVAVIAPAIPSLFSVLGPVIIISAFTFLVAIPRWFLVFAHWLWVRIVPQSLRDRSIPGMQCHTFEGVALRRFADDYTFSVPDGGDVKNHIKSFFEKRGARPEDDGEALTFSRGHRMTTYFLPHIIPWRERDFLQRITVKTRRTLEGRMDVHVHYVVQTLCMLRLQPAGLRNEVCQLLRELNVPA